MVYLMTRLSAHSTLYALADPIEWRASEMSLLCKPLVTYLSGIWHTKHIGHELFKICVYRYTGTLATI